MPRSALQALVVASIVLLAGCTGPGAQSPSTPDDGPATTPTPSPTGSPAPSNDTYPAGLTGDGVASAWNLASTHAALLSGTSYTVEESTVLRSANGSLLRRTDRTVRVAAAPNVYRYRTTVRGAVPTFLEEPNGTLVAHSNGSLVAEKVMPGDGNASYRVATDADGNPVPPVRYVHGSPANQERAFVLLSRAEVNVTGPGSGPYRLEATDFVEGRLTVDGVEVANASMESFAATVQQSGLVSEYRLVVTGTVDGRRVTATEHVVYSGVGSTDPSTPPWFDRAT